MGESPGRLAVGEELRFGLGRDRGVIEARCLGRSLAVLGAAPLLPLLLPVFLALLLVLVLLGRFAHLLWFALEHRGCWQCARLTSHVSRRPTIRLADAMGECLNDATRI